MASATTTSWARSATRQWCASTKLAPAGVTCSSRLRPSTRWLGQGSARARVIEDAERRGELRPGQTIVEATSGNTGIGLAMVCAQRGYPLVVTMAENFSVERRKLMRFLGARVVLTPAAQKGSGMVAKAEELARAHGWWQPRQFENPANAEVHARTTAVEILDDFADIGLDYWVTGFGTGGTLNGVSRVLRERSPHTRIIVCEPDNSAMLASGIAQARHADGSISTSHPRFPPALDAGLVTGLRAAARAASRRRWSHRRLCADRRSGCAALHTRAGDPGGHLRRRFRRGHAGGRLAGRRVGSAGVEHPVHAARHRRALSVDTAVRWRGGRDDRRGTRDLALDPGSVSTSRRRQPPQNRPRRSTRWRRASSTR